MRIIHNFYEHKEIVLISFQLDDLNSYIMCRQLVPTLCMFLKFAAKDAKIF